MKTQIDCFPCFFKQATLASRMAGGDEKLQKKALIETAGLLYTAPLDRDPPYIATGIFHKVNEIMGTTDPYRKVKDDYNKIVAEKYTDLINIIKKDTDPLRAAVKLALAGNIIDFGILEQFDLDAVIEQTMSTVPAIDEYQAMKQMIERAQTLLFITDNAGEIGFDRLLIDEIHQINKEIRITVAVKKIPIINDATIYDAQFFGIDVKNKLIDNGSNHIGTYLPSCSSEMIEAFTHADMIISKGQANWESLEENAPDKMWFLLKAKCRCVAEFLKVKLGDILIVRGRHAR
ncbi:MAG: ARMT1-like domain-containing protein [bacterium]